jgi:hypothetical protein
MAMAKLHPRFFIVRKAALEAQEAMAKIEQKHGLTIFETLGVLEEMMQDEIKYGLRAERHPDDPEKKGNEE